MIYALMADGAWCSLFANYPTYRKIELMDAGDAAPKLVIDGLEKAFLKEWNVTVQTWEAFIHFYCL